MEVPGQMGGECLDAILAQLLPERSRAAWQKAVRRGQVRVDGKRVLRSNVRIGGGARLRIQLPASEVASDPSRLSVIHEDQDILVIDKPAGLLTHGNEKNREESLADLVVERYGRLPLLMGEERPGVVHRLDRQTSGVTVLARTAEAMEHLREAFRSREVRKQYLALVHGQPRSKTLQLDWNLGPQGDHPDRQECCSGDRGKPASTKVELIEVLGEQSLLRCTPTTGRRHQIRVHLSAAGLPIVADELYGLRGAPDLPQGAPRLRCHALHAQVLAFRHPRTGLEVEFRAEPPAAINELVDWLRGQ
jgi:23S rRNA pseudouridine1911/1915/1917 synthase